jgi:hypothetical protein
MGETLFYEKTTQGELIYLKNICCYCYCFTTFFCLKDNIML